MKRANYISNLDLSRTTGGWTGANFALHQELSRTFSLNVVGPINPGSDLTGKLISKTRRSAGLPGSFHFFSQKRLKQIAQLVAEQVDETADFDYFHGPTPWILYQSARPYFVFTDTCFSTYLSVYHDRTRFSAGDVQRIQDAEARWLERATRVFFGTQWALEQTANDYGISRSNLSRVGAGGCMNIPEADRYSGGMNFLFVSFDFERKGGRICAAAFEVIRRQYPQATLTIIGQQPPAGVLSVPGVSYVGFLDKAVPEQLRQLEQLYAAAFALVHPTSSDIQPLVVCEVGYFGCPTISAKSFGLPELIQDEVTGLLIEPTLTASAVAERMRILCEDHERYLKMRKAVRQYATTNLTWEAVGSRISNLIESCASEPNRCFAKV